MKLNRVLWNMMSILLMAGMLFGCAPAPTPTAVTETEAAPVATEAAPSGGEKIKVGLSFSDFATERWKNEEVLMRKLLEEKGYEVLFAGSQPRRQAAERPDRQHGQPGRQGA